MRTRIRRAAPEDLEALRGVFQRSALVYEDGRDDLLAHPEALEFSFPTTGDWVSRVAVSEDGRIVGFATGLFRGESIELEDLFVEPDCMRQGIGTALIDDMTDVARRHNIGRIEVMANPNALAFYEKTGFVIDHEVQMQFGPGLQMHLDVG